MSDKGDDIEDADASEKNAPRDQTEPDAKARGGSSRVRFKGIVEAGRKDPATSDGAPLTLTRINDNEQLWNSMSRQIWLSARLMAIFVFMAFMVGLPLGNYLGYVSRLGSASGWSIWQSYQTDFLIFSLVIPVLILFAGYAGSRITIMVSAAEAVAAAAQSFITPDEAAAKNVDTVGLAVRGHMTAFNEGLDGALSRLASVEAMIRQHVEAIEISGQAIEQKAVNAVERVADERSRLMELTESLNAHADSFAAAIAEKAKKSMASLQSAEEFSLSAEKDFDERLDRLEEAANRALSSFESLREALRDTDGAMRASAESIDGAAKETLKATERATAASNAAAESAARNAANVAASANRASEAARKAADDAIAAASEEAERVSSEAIRTALSEGERIQAAADKALGDISKTTKEAIKAAVADADKATKAASDVSKAARETSEAAAKASADVTAAREQAQKSSKEAIDYSETAKTRIEERNQALAEARAALEKENERLETLIDEQRKRADRLADAIASQTERLSRLAEAQLREQEAAVRLAEAQNEMHKRAQNVTAEKAVEPAPEEKKTTAPKRDERETLRGGAERLEELARDIAQRRPKKQTAARAEPPLQLEKEARRRKGDVSWREILDAADDAEPLELGEVAKPKSADAARDEAENAIKTIARLQQFTYDLETRLYGDPPPALQERFDRGDRNVFANRLLRLNEADVKRRIRMESARDRKFEKNIHAFLQGFERLLEDATTSETADEELEEYLSSPLGRIYLLIGATVGYFA